MKKATKRIIARIMAVMMVVSILPFDMWGTANVVMAEELSGTDDGSSENAGEDLAVEGDVADTGNEGADAALVDDTENTGDAEAAEEPSLPEEADETEGGEDVSMPEEDAEMEADVENSEEGGDLEDPNIETLTASLDTEDAEMFYDINSETGLAIIRESMVAHNFSDANFNYETVEGEDGKKYPYFIGTNASAGKVESEDHTYESKALEGTIIPISGKGHKFDSKASLKFEVGVSATIVLVYASETADKGGLTVNGPISFSTTPDPTTTTKVVEYEQEIEAGAYEIKRRSSNSAQVDLYYIAIIPIDEGPSVAFADETGKPALETDNDADKTYVGDTLSLSYTLTYKDKDEDGNETSTTVESGNEKDSSTISWYRVGSANAGKDDAKEENQIKDESGKSYTLTTADVGKYIMAAVTPKVSETEGKTAYVVWKNVVSNVAGAPEAPTGNPDEGVVEEGTSVTLSAEDGTVIYYTIDEPAPAVSEDGKSVSGEKYTDPITIDKTHTIRAIAVKGNDTDGYLGSGVKTLKYTVAKMYTLDFTTFTEKPTLPFNYGIFQTGSGAKIDGDGASISDNENNYYYNTNGNTTYQTQNTRLLQFKFPSGTVKADITINVCNLGTSARSIAIVRSDSKTAVSSGAWKSSDALLYGSTEIAAGPTERENIKFTIDVDSDKSYAVATTNAFCIYSITVAAIGDIQERTVNFYNGETKLDSQTVEEGRTVTAPSVDPEEGKKFVGWFEKDSETAFDLTAGVKADTDLYAKWEDITYTVTYRNNYTGEGVEDVYDTQTIKYNETVTAPTQEPTRGENYRFLGWCTDEACENDYTFGNTISKDLELYAKWEEIIKYTVTFYHYSYEDGSGKEIDCEEKKEIEQNDQVEKPTDPTRDDYTFEGWYLDEEFNDEVEFPYTVKADVTFYAKWMGYAAKPSISPDTAEITQKTKITLDSETENAKIYYTTDGTTPTEGVNEYTKDGFTLGNTVNEGDTVTIKAIAIADGYNNSKVAERSYTIVSSEGYVSVPEADCTPGKVEAGTQVGLSNDESAVIFYTTDGKTDPVTKGEDGTITIASGAEEFTEDILIRHTTTIKAAAVLYDNEVPKAASAVVSFIYTVEEIKPEARPDDEIVDADDKVELYIPEGADDYSDEVKIYYTTDGSVPDTESDEYKDDTEILISDDITVKAIAVYDGYSSGVATFVYTLNEYTVTFDSGEGSEVEEQTVKSGQMASKPDDPTWKGYTFEGWYTDEECTEGNEYVFTDKVKENITLYAKWDKLKSVLLNTTEWNFTGEFFGNLGLDTDKSTTLKNTHNLDGITVGGDSGTVKAKPTESNLSVADKGIIYIPIGKDTEAVELTVTLANGGVDDKRYIIIGEGNDKETVYQKTSDENALHFDSALSYTNENLYFKEYGVFGTTLQIAGYGGENKIGSIILKEYRLVSENAKIYTVQFNTGEGSNVEDQSVISGDKATQPTDPTRTGYTFGGWYKDEDCTQEYDFDAEVTANITLYAKWTAATPETTYTVQFNTGEGSNVEDQNVVSGGKATKPTDPTRTGYTFGGWYKDEDCTEEYDFDTEVTANITLYAKWTTTTPETTYTVQFNTGEGSNVEDQSVVSGGKAAKPADPTRTGYTFGGWYKDAAYAEEYNFDTEVTANITLYAKWIGYAAKPTISPATEKITQNTEITLNSTTENAKIYYTTDGSEPSTSSTEYSGAFTLGNAVNEGDIVTIKAIATATGYNNSEVAEVTYTIVSSEGYVNVPRASVTEGTVDAGTSVSLTADGGAEIYYTTDGTTVPASKGTDGSITIANGATKFTEAIIIKHTTTIKAAAVMFNGTEPSAVSDVVTFDYTVEEKKPVANPAEGAVDAGAKVTLSIPNGAGDYSENVKIYYTTDGNEPDTSSNEYTTEIVISEAMTIKAIAVYDGFKSEVATYEYTIKASGVTVEKPTANPVDGTEVAEGTKIALSCNTEGATIHYTTDGSAPTAASPAYTGEITVTKEMIVNNAVTVKAFASKDGMTDSEVATFTYTVTPPGTVAMPIATPVSGSIVKKGDSITLSCSTEGATIHYTTDGTEAKETSPAYSAAIKVTDAIISNNKVTINAIAVKSGMTNSAKATFTYGVSNDNVDENDGRLVIDFADEADGVYTYTGSAIKPEITVSYGDRPLVEGVDYSVKYTNNVKVGDPAAGKKAPTVKVTGKGILAGTTEKSFTIEQRSLTDERINASNIAVIVGKKATPVIYYNGIKLNNKDYQVKDGYSLIFSEAGDAELVVTGIGNFKDDLSIPVKVYATKADLNAAAKKFKVIVDKPKTNELIYTGESLREKITECFTVEDKNDGQPLKEEDYVVAYPNNLTAAGTVKFTVVGLNDYSGVTVTKSVKILPRTIKQEDVVLYGDASASTENKVVIDGIEELKYISTGATYNKLSLTLNGTELKAGKDYKISYSGNKKVGSSAKYTITFMGNYKGKYVSPAFEIGQAELSSHTEGIEVYIPDKVAKKNGVCKSTPYVSINGVTVKASEYTVKYYTDPGMELEMNGSNPVVFGENDSYKTVYVKIVPKGRNYVCENEADYKTGEYNVWLKDAAKMDLSKAKITFLDENNNKITKLEYQGGEVVEPAKISVKIGKGDDIPAEGNWEVKFVNNVEKGKATAIINADPDSEICIGGKTATFSIVSRKLTLKDWLGELLP